MEADEFPPGDIPVSGIDSVDGPSSQKVHNFSVQTFDGLSRSNKGNEVDIKTFNECDPFSIGRDSVFGPPFAVEILKSFNNDTSSMKISYSPCRIDRCEIAHPSKL